MRKAAHGTTASTTAVVTPTRTTCSHESLPRPASRIESSPASTHLLGLEVGGGVGVGVGVRVRVRVRVGARVRVRVRVRVRLRVWVRVLGRGLG